jgi:acylphosphatase
MICRRSFVSGRVQGVFYRATCVRKAQSLGLAGFARNLADGRVEVLACGEAAAVDALRGVVVGGLAGLEGHRGGDLGGGSRVDSVAGGLHFGVT